MYVSKTIIHDTIQSRRLYSNSLGKIPLTDDNLTSYNPMHGNGYYIVSLSILSVVMQDCVTRDKMIEWLKYDS
jgi:hypothetical protein